jgi:hypothetical protein
MFRASFPIFNGAPRASRYFATRAAVADGSATLTVACAGDASLAGTDCINPAELSASGFNVAAFELVEPIDGLIRSSLFVP